MVNYYDILGISPDATQVEIKRAYKEQAKLYHPDANQGDPEKEEQFKIINDAYQTLSNAYSKSNYDLMMRYGYHNEPTATSQYKSPPDWMRQRRPPMNRPRFNSRKNMVATGYAFLFAFIMAAIIKTGIYFVQKHQAEERTRILTERRDFFKRAVKEKENRNYATSLDLLDSMGRFYIEESDMRDYKDQLVYDIRDIADQHLENGEFEEAIGYYNMLSEYSVSSTITYMLKMAKAFQGLGDFKETLKIYQVVRMYGYDNTSFYYDMGNLYEMAGDPDLALEHYQKGAELAASEYEVTIGKAYPVVINASMIPYHHYGIYLKVSEMHLQLKQYEEAIQSVAWSKEIWKDSLRLVEIEAISYQGLGQTQRMQESISRARKIDPEFSL